MFEQIRCAVCSPVRYAFRAGAALLAMVLVSGVARAQEDYDLVLPDVPLHAGSTADIHLRVYVNEQAPCNDRTLLVVQGSNEQSSYWAGFAEALFEDNPTGSKVCRVAVLDFPGHGDSSLPTGGLLFGEITLQDHARILREVLERLPGLGLRPRTIVAHSLGGMPVQLLQQELLDSGSDLRQAFGIKHVVFFASVLPAGLVWTWADQIAQFTDFFHLCYTGPDGAIAPGCEGLDLNGDGHVDYGDLLLVFPIQLDCDPLTAPLGDPPLPAPGPGLCDDMSGLGDVYDPGDQGASLTAVMQAVSGFQYQRPQIDAGIFARGSGTRLSVVSFALDGGHLSIEDEQLFDHLADGGGSKGRSAGEFLLIDTAHAIHEMPLLFPEEMLDAMAGNVSLP